MSRTIVVPLGDPAVDVHRFAERALPYARILARRRDAVVLLVSALEGGDGLQERADARERYLGEIADGLQLREVRTVVEAHSAARTILDIAADAADPVVVIASHGRAGIARLTMGSVASQVARESTCPVLIVPAAEDAPALEDVPPMRRVLVLAGEPGQVDALVDATIAALVPIDPAEIELHLLEVTPPIPSHPDVQAKARYEGAHEPAAHYLRSIAARLQERGYTATWDLRIGDPAEETTRLAAETAADLIVAPSDASVSGLIARQAQAARPVPVLLTPVWRGDRWPYRDEVDLLLHRETTR